MIGTRALIERNGDKELWLYELPHSSGVVAQIYQGCTVIPTGSVDVRTPFQDFTTRDEAVHWVNTE